MSWPDVVFELIYATPSRNGIYKSKEFHGRGSRIVNMGELFGYDFISNQDMKRVELSGREQENSLLDDGDLLFGRRSLVESGAGKCSLVVSPLDELSFESSIIRVRLNKNAANPRFYYYYFLSPEGRGRVRSIVSGVNVKGIRGSDLRRLSVAHPPKEIQDKVVNILSAYDDLIENNRRRMTLLEESARLLYREWFVRLRFPGHEHTRNTNGVPDGWGRRTALESLQVLSGGTPKTTVPDYWDGDVPFYTPKDAVDGIWVAECERTVTELGVQNCASKLYPKGTVFITARGTVGKLNMAQRAMAMSQSCYALVGKDHLSQTFVYVAMKEAVAALRQHAVGAVFDAIVVDTFKRIDLLLPPPALMREFDAIAQPIFDQVENLMMQNEKLRVARDLLLPRLMSGEIVA